MTRRELVGIHEGAHAALALRMGVPVAFAEVRDDGSGRVHFERPSRAVGREVKAAIYTAGAVAEAVIGGSRVFVGCDMDFGNAGKELAGRSRTELDELVGVVRGLVRELMPIIRRIGSVLAIEGRLDGAQLAELYRRQRRWN